MKIQENQNAIKACRYFTRVCVCVMTISQSTEEYCCWFFICLQSVHYTLISLFFIICLLYCLDVYVISNVFYTQISKEKIDCLRFVMCPLLAPHFQPFFLFCLAVAINSTNETTRQAVHAINQYIFLRCLWLTYLIHTKHVPDYIIPISHLPFMNSF